MIKMERNVYDNRKDNFYVTEEGRIKLMLYEN